MHDLAREVRGDPLRAGEVPLLEVALLGGLLGICGCGRGVPSVAVAPQRGELEINAKNRKTPCNTLGTVLATPKWARNSDVLYYLSEKELGRPQHETPGRYS